MTAIRKPRDPDMPASVAPAPPLRPRRRKWTMADAERALAAAEAAERKGVPVTPADVEAKLRRAGKLKLDVELAAFYMAHAKSEFRRSLDALHGALVDEIRRMQ